MKLRKTAIEVTAQIEYMLIQSFKGFELCSLLGIHVFSSALGWDIAHIKIHLFELLREENQN